MKRRLVKQGLNAITVTLPSKWIKKFGLKAGGEVDIEEKEKSLILTTGKAISLNKVSIDISELDESLVWTYIIAAYRKGCDEIEVHFKNLDSIRLIQQVVDALLGLAIINQGEHFCMIKDLGQVSEGEFDNVLRRIFLLLKSMSQDVFNALRIGNNSVLKNMEFQDYNINKFSNYCLRLLNKIGYPDYTKTIAYHYIIAELENLGDEYTRLAWNAVNAKPSKSVVSVFEQVNLLFDLYYQFFYKFDNKLAVDIVERKEKITKQIEDLIKSKKLDDIKITYHLSKIVHLIINMVERQVMVSL